MYIVSQIVIVFLISLASFLLGVRVGYHIIIKALDYCLEDTNNDNS